MTPKQLEAAGRELYGEQWQTPLADALGVSDRTVRRWLAGDRAIPDGLAAELDWLRGRKAASVALDELARTRVTATDSIELELKASSIRRYPMTARAIAAVLAPLGIKLKIGAAK